MTFVTVTSELFARLTGRRGEMDTLLFEVSPHFLDQAESDEWRGPVLYRFAKREGAFVAIEFRKVEGDGS